MIRIKNRIIALVFSIASLLCLVAENVFTYYIIKNQISQGTVYYLSFSYILNIASWIMLLLYVIFIYKKKWQRIFLGVLVMLIALPAYFSAISFFKGFGGLQNLILSVVQALLLTFLAVCIFNGKNVKAIACGALGVMIFIQIFNTVSTLSTPQIFNFLGSTYLFALIIGAIGNVLFYASLLFACLIHGSERINVKTAEEQLTLLKERYELGLITEDEYQLQRESVINNL